jgi:choline kinase
MKAIILAAGIASRLRPLTDTTPKCLLQIGNRCLLQRSVDNLKQNGITDFVIVTGYRQQQIADFLNTNYPELNIKFIYNEQYESTNNIYSLWLTHSECEHEDCLLLDSDIVYDAEIVSQLMRCGKKDALAVCRHELGDEEMKVITDADGYVSLISKQCPIEQSMGESIGIELMSADYTAALFKELEQMITREGLSNIFYERAFERLIPQGHRFFALDTTGLFSVELDTVDDFRQAQKLIPAHLF